MNEWDIYQFTSKKRIHGMKVRGRIRKYSLQNAIPLLTENASDEENVVRFALPAETNSDTIKQFIISIIPDAKFEAVLMHVKNPILSKLNVNDEERYEI